MPLAQYDIEFKNSEEQEVFVRIQDQDDAVGGSFTLEASDEPNNAPAIMESVNTDDDKTTPVKPKRLRVGFNSDVFDVKTFSDGADGRFTITADTSGLGLPFWGNVVLDDNQEAFQPKPNSVQLIAADGLNSLSQIELKTQAGDMPVGHYSIIDYISMCLSNLNPTGQSIIVVMNLYEKTRLRSLSANFNITATNKFRIPYSELGFLSIGDTIEISGSTSNNGSYTINGLTVNGTTSIDIQVTTSTFVLETTVVFIFRSNGHTFEDVFLDALTFEKDVDSREDCLTVLTKILDWAGCFICYDHDGWYIIRWDEYDGQAAITTMKAAYFDISTGDFQAYANIDLNKIIAADYDPLYEGYRLSQDNALRRFQRKSNKVVHTYKFNQITAPCNKDFRTLGPVIDDVIPLKTYEVACWDLFRGFGAHAGTPNVDAQIWIRYDANDNESERYLVLTPQASSGGQFNYVRSQAMPIDEKDKFTFSFDYSADSDNAVAGPATITIGAIELYGVDNSVWILGDNATTPTDAVPEWKLSDANNDVNADYYRWFLTGSEDLTEFQTYSIEAPPAPVSGDLYIHLFAQGNLASAIDDFAIRYNNIQFTYIPFTNGTYGTINGQSTTIISGDTRGKVIEKEMFISDSPKRLFKGAMKKFDGTNYVLTETWNYYNDTTVLPDQRFSLFILFQWWNQFKKTRTVIESDFQGINSDQELGIPGLIHRWKINHAQETSKYFMLTSLRDLNFRTCGWAGVMVEMSDNDGDRSYLDDFTFKYIQ